MPVRSTASNGSTAFSIPQTQKSNDIIVENNLFRPLGWERDLGPPVEQNLTPAPEPAVEPAPPPPTYGLALTGIVKKGTHFLAVIEDQRMKSGVFLRSGEPLKDTRIQEIAPDHITLTRGEMAVKLALGERIEYGTDGRVRFGTIAKKQGFGAPAEDDDGSQDLIERMRERRRTELSQ